MKKLISIFLILFLFCAPQTTVQKTTSLKPTYLRVIYHGNIESKIFHKSSCRYYNCKNCIKNFSSREEALRAGYRPCKVCKP